MNPFTLLHGDCLTVMRGMADSSVDAIITDPPYEIGFMGKGWDKSGIANSVEMWREALRVLKPGGHLLAFSGSRTYHRMVCAIEDAGFEVRDQIMWLYGSGFPKSRNLGGMWEGWGTALKPAHEPICVARKPLDGTVAANVLAHGTGALNIDACRVAPTGERLGGGDENGKASKPEGWARPWMDDPDRVAAHNAKVRSNVEKATELGRWPANVIHDGSDEVLAAFPDAVGQQGALSGEEPSCKTKNTFGEFERRTASEPRREADRSAARFFYCAKASRSDRNAGVGGSDVPAVTNGATMREREGADWSARNGNHHPTVKPTELMAYLVRLVTPPGGLVLDPFLGSGSTGKACMREGFRFIGIDMTPEYVEIAQARIEHEFRRVQDAERAAAASVSPQMPLFSEAA